eukprot:6188016-Pleurochrysis_carterae.AAC.2
MRSPAAVLPEFCALGSLREPWGVRYALFKRQSSAGPWHSHARRVALQVRSGAACSSSTRQAGGRPTRTCLFWPTTCPQSNS